MIEIRIIDSAHKKDINLPNQPFPLWGRMIVSCSDRTWSYQIEEFSSRSDMCFPDENYDFDTMSHNSIFVGAYDGETCIGLAILQTGFFKYLYLYDLKVLADYRRCGIAAKLIQKAREIALSKGYRGLYTIGQDNNLSACLFYLHTGFRIGGYDTEVYKGTSQEGKADILFYLG